MIKSLISHKTQTKQQQKKTQNQSIYKVQKTFISIIFIYKKKSSKNHLFSFYQPSSSNIPFSVIIMLLLYAFMLSVYLVMKKSLG
jgi:hypothetical protein